MAIEDPNEMERTLVERAHRKAMAQRRARHITEAIDPEGQVRVWNFASRTYQRLWPVDAAEQIANRTAAIDVVELIGPEGLQVVGADVEDVLLAEGWRRPGQEAAPQVPEAPAGGGEPAPPASDRPTPGPTAGRNPGTKSKTKPSGAVANEPAVPQDSPEPTP